MRHFLFLPFFMLLACPAVYAAKPSSCEAQAHPPSPIFSLIKKSHQAKQLDDSDLERMLASRRPLNPLYDKEKSIYDISLRNGLGRNLSTLNPEKWKALQAEIRAHLQQVETQAQVEAVTREETAYVFSVKPKYSFSNNPDHLTVVSHKTKNGKWLAAFFDKDLHIIVVNIETGKVEYKSPLAYDVKFSKTPAHLAFSEDAQGHVAIEISRIAKDESIQANFSFFPIIETQSIDLLSGEISRRQFQTPMKLSHITQRMKLSNGEEIYVVENHSPFTKTPERFVLSSTGAFINAAITANGPTEILLSHGGRAFVALSGNGLRTKLVEYANGKFETIWTGDSEAGDDLVDLKTSPDGRLLLVYFRSGSGPSASHGLRLEFPLETGESAKPIDVNSDWLTARVETYLSFMKTRDGHFLMTTSMSTNSRLEVFDLSAGSGNLIFSTAMPTPRSQASFVNAGAQDLLLVVGRTAIRPFSWNGSGFDGLGPDIKLENGQQPPQLLTSGADRYLVTYYLKKFTFYRLHARDGGR